MRLSPARKETMREHQNIPKISKEEKEASRKKRKKMSKFKVSASIEKKKINKVKMMNIFFYEFEGGFFKVKKHNSKSQCIRKYKEEKYAIRFCKVANIVKV